jgi:hypothetical protein
MRHLGLCPKAIYLFPLYCWFVSPGVVLFLFARLRVVTRRAGLDCVDEVVDLAAVVDLDGVLDVRLVVLARGVRVPERCVVAVGNVSPLCWSEVAVA